MTRITVRFVIVGILSDTHDRVESARAGIHCLLGRSAEFLIHCGDVGGRRIIDLLADLPAALVWGNTDRNCDELTNYAHTLGVKVLPRLGQIELGGKRIAVTHGDDGMLVRMVLDDQQHDYLLVGHTHLRADRRVGRVRLINPGALHRTADKSVALLDTAADAVTFIRV